MKKATVLKAVPTEKKERPKLFIYDMNQLDEMALQLSYCQSIADALSNVEDGTALKGGTIISLGCLMSEKLEMIDSILCLKSVYEVSEGTYKEKPA